MMDQQNLGTMRPASADPAAIALAKALGQWPKPSGSSRPSPKKVFDSASPAAVEALARRLAIPQWIAEALPQDKATRIRALSDDGAKVLMVGDGLNDTAALAAAHVSISPASALDAARVASDIVLLGNALAPLPEAIATARSLGQPSRGRTSRKSTNPQLSIARAALPILSPSCGSIRMITGGLAMPPVSGLALPTASLIGSDLRS